MCRRNSNCENWTILLRFTLHSTGDIYYLTQMSILTIHVFLSATYSVFHTFRDSLLIANICLVSEGMVWFIWKLCDLCLSRYEFHENVLVLCRNDRKKVKFVQKNFICTINQLPFPFKIFQQQRGLFYSRINITHTCTHTN